MKVDENSLKGVRASRKGPALEAPHGKGSACQFDLRA